MLVNFGDAELKYCYIIRNMLQDLGVSAEIYPDAVKMKKQLAYANSKKIPYVLIAGENEIKNYVITVKSMQTGEQKTVSIAEFKTFIISEMNLKTD